MALYRLEVRIIGRSAGKRADGARAYRSGSAAAAGAYRRGARTTSMTAEGRRVHDYSKKRGVIHTETLAPEGAPAWATNSEHLWQIVETAEKRKDSQLARELLITLPLDVPLRQCLAALQAWLAAEAVALGMVADLAIHGYGTPLDPQKLPQAARIAELRGAGLPIYRLAPGDLLRDMPPEGNHAWLLPDGQVLAYQPHAHVMLTMRDIGPHGLGNKRRDWNSTEQVRRWRESWERVYNHLLASAACGERVSAKTRWEQEADRWSQLSDPSEPKPSRRILRRQINLDGGIYAAMDGRPATQHYGDMLMSAFDWNETERDMRRREEVAETKLEAAKSREAAAANDRRGLLRVLARVTELTALGVEFIPVEDGRITVRGATSRFTEADRKQFNEHARVLQPILKAAPDLAPPPKLDDKLAAAVSLIEQHQNEGVKFFRTEKGTLGYEPRDAISAETYRRFSGMHEAILTELDRREHVALRQEARAQVAEKDKLLRSSEEEAQRLKLSLKAERQQRVSLELGAAVLIESASTGTEWPGTGDESPLLTRLRNTFNGVRRRMVDEKQRADKLQRALTFLKKSFFAFVGSLVRKYPADEAELQVARDQILSDVAAMEPPRLASEGPTERHKVKPPADAQDAAAKPNEARTSPPAKSPTQPKATKVVPPGRPAGRRDDFER